MWSYWNIEINLIYIIKKCFMGYTGHTMHIGCGCILGYIYVLLLYWFLGFYDVVYANTRFLEIEDKSAQNFVGMSFIQVSKFC